MVDWDKIEAEVTKEEKEEDLEGDEGAQKLFRTIYAGARLSAGLQQWEMACATN